MFDFDAPVFVRKVAVSATKSSIGVAAVVASVRRVLFKCGFCELPFGATRDIYPSAYLELRGLIFE